MAELQFSHTKMGFIIDLRKLPHEETPLLQKKKKGGKAFFLPT